MIALGAILAFAVNGHPSFLNIQIAGWVIILTGLAGMLVPKRRYAAVRRRIVRQRPAAVAPGSAPVTEIDERRYRLTERAQGPAPTPMASIVTS